MEEQNDSVSDNLELVSFLSHLRGWRVHDDCTGADGMKIRSPSSLLRVPAGTSVAQHFFYTFSTRSFSASPSFSFLPVIALGVAYNEDDCQTHVLVLIYSLFCL